MAFSPKSSGSSRRWSQPQRPPAWLNQLGQPPLLATLVASAVVLGVRALGALQGLELGAYDQMMRQRSPLPPDDRILVVGIDEADIQSRQEWPIADDTVAELLSTLVVAEPRAIGLDLFRDVPIGEGRTALLNQLQNNELILSVCKLSSPDNPGVPPPPETTKYQVGFSDLVVDSGGILRRNLLIAEPPADSLETGTHLCNTQDGNLLSLGLQLALRYLAAEGIEPEFTAQQELRLDGTVLSRLQANTGGYYNADVRGYQILLNYRAAKTAVSQVSLTDVLSGNVDEAEIRDRIVLVGVTTPEAKDEFYTPFSGDLRDSQKMSGAMVHAQSISQILSAVLDDQPLLWSWTTWTEAGWIILWGLGGALFAWYVRRPVTFAVVALVLLAALYGVSYAVFLQGGWIPLIPAALAAGIASGGVVLLDRFNKSDYGQAVYKQMKSLLRIEIEIDRAKVGEQVAEITETDYFSNLQAQAQELRERRQNAVDSSSQGDHSDTANNTASPAPPPSSSEPAPAADSSDADYFADLQQRAQRFKASGRAEPDADAQD
ncbi:MAG: CHASE2 domain-containing protein [Cyanobacteria bacterium P01_H01_bin.153]